MSRGPCQQACAVLRKCVVVASLSAAVDGCSLVAVHGPPRGHEQLDTFDCTVEDELPSADVALGLTLAASMATFTYGERRSLSAGAEGSLLGAGGAVMVLAIVSALDGFATTSECREARIAAGVRRAARETRRHEELLEALRARGADVNLPMPSPGALYPAPEPVPVPLPIEPIAPP